jgi:hypothetical protein
VLLSPRVWKAVSGRARCELWWICLQSLLSFYHRTKKPRLSEPQSCSMDAKKRTNLLQIKQAVWILALSVTGLLRFIKHLVISFRLGRAAAVTHKCQVGPTSRSFLKHCRIFVQDGDHS